MKLLAFAVLALLAVTQAEEGARLLASKSLLNRYAVEGRDLTLQYNIYNVGSSAALDVELSDDSFPPEDFGIVSGMLNVKWDRIAPAGHLPHPWPCRGARGGERAFPESEAETGFGLNFSCVPSPPGLANAHRVSRMCPGSQSPPCPAENPASLPSAQAFFRLKLWELGRLGRPPGAGGRSGGAHGTGPDTFSSFFQIGFTSAPGQGGILAQREFDRRFSPHFLDWAAFGVMTLPSIGIPLLLWYSSKRKYDTPKARKN
ncbi:LOW QUALITY PROTEIN: translocon-associated protein subunit beta [Pteropus vampyrus]|uniref:LOW QUALITY PROTEIN: translocon-associated protein subunit beta n=1 Tax=Pteropus vampyrus TaxID=132908 RepID=A0A6P6CT80_PTEVA|nr:LOW QUALITY PROTEIN: translocon-associated protein subunit beta [Pteropus vampyrus]